MAKIDSEDELKRQARRRLIGAVALVTALVLILPMVLDKEPRPSGQSIELRIPDKDKAGAFTSQMVLPESAVAPVTAAASAPAAATVVTPPVAAKPAKPAPTKHAPKPAVTKPAPVKSAPAKPAPAKPEHKTGENTQSAAPKAGFAVQVGAFANAATAKDLQEKLRQQGWHVYTEKAGEAIRVRVGPYLAREAAENALHKLEAQGLHPAVVTEP